MSSFNDLKLPKNLLTNIDTIVVGYSGGVDSHVLLFWLQQYLQQHKLAIELRALHINHNLNPNCHDWAQHTKAVCDSLGITYYYEEIYLQHSKDGSLENKARNKRYEIYQQYLGPSTLLCTAHHLNDQVETLLFRLMRGMGNFGAAGIPYARELASGKVIRPLLSITKSDILEYAKVNHLVWVEDHTNEQNTFDRNFLRNDVLPLLVNRWPQGLTACERFIENNLETVVLLEEVAEIDLKTIKSGTYKLNLALLEQLSIVRQKNLLKYFIKSLGYQCPSSKQLQLIISQVINTRQNTMPCLIIRNYEIRKFANNLYVLPNIQWQPMPNTLSLACPNGLMVLPNNTSLKLSQTSNNGIIIQDLNNLVVKFRVGKEILLKPDGTHVKLKKMLHHWQIPPWLRGILPIIQVGSEIISIPGYYTNHRYSAKDGQIGWKLEWVNNNY